MIAAIGTFLIISGVIMALGFLTVQLGIMPNPDPPDLTGMVDTIAPVFAHVAWANKYFPLDQAAIILGVLVVAWVPLYGIRVTIWMLVKTGVLKG